MKATLPVCLLVAAGVATPIGAQNHPELDWQVVETEHFRILFHQGLDEAASYTAEVAEAAYGPVTDLYGYEPSSHIRIILKDYDDYANGAAFFYLDTIEIWTSALDHDYELRGATDWLGNVVTHEFTHVISLGAARKASQRVPALYLQYLGYQREQNRPDILIGYPDVIASYPVVATVSPMWFAEGIAQHQVQSARHDRWDSHRDMALRTAVVNDQLLSLDEMGVFGKRGFGNEYVYDHGYGLVRYIAHTYGDEALADICRSLSQWKSMTIGSAFQSALGVSAEQVYESWRDSMRLNYRAQIEGLGELREGRPLDDAAGFSNLHPSFSPDGKRLAYLSTQNRHNASHALIVRDLETDEEEVIASPVVSSISWSADGERILWVRKDKADRYGSRQADIYEYDSGKAKRSLASRMAWSAPATLRGYGSTSPQLRRLSRGLRGMYPAYSPDGEWISFVHNKGRSNNLGLMRADGSEVRYLTEYGDGTQLYTPRWSPDGRRLVVSISRRGQRDIVLVDMADIDAAVAVRPLVATVATERDPVWSPSGEEVLFASDASGIFNIYSVDVEGKGSVKQVTNVVGGAITPTIGPDGTVAFAAFGPDGYRINLIDAALDSAIAIAYDADESGGWHCSVEPVSEPGSTSQIGGSALVELASIGQSSASADIGVRTTSPSRPYGVDILRTLVLPRLVVDEGRLKAGVYAASSDVLMKQSVLVGAALAPANGDRDLFALYDYRRWRPTVFLEFYNQKRHTSRGDSSAARTGIVTGMNFSLNEVRTGARGKLGRYADLELALTYDRYDASIEWDFFETRQDGQPGFRRAKQRPFGYTYLQGFGLGLIYRLEVLSRRRDRDISPRGRRLLLQYDRMFNYFLEGFDEGNVSFLQEEYVHLFYNQFTVDWREYVGLPRDTALGLRLFGGWIASDKVDDEDLVSDFFDYHLGGLNFMRGYTFYSMEGRKAFMANGTFRFPLLADTRRRFAHLYVDKLYGAVYGDVGKAWDGDFDDPDRFYGRTGMLRDVGTQLRLDMISYYSMPTRVQADLAYGLDEVEDRNPWKFYLTVLFGYL